MCWTMQCLDAIVLKPRTTLVQIPCSICSTWERGCMQAWPNELRWLSSMWESKPVLWKICNLNQLWSSTSTSEELAPSWCWSKRYIWLPCCNPYTEHATVSVHTDVYLPLLPLSTGREITHLELWLFWLCCLIYPTFVYLAGTEHIEQQEEWKATFHSLTLTRCQKWSLIIV